MKRRREKGKNGKVRVEREEKSERNETTMKKRGRKERTSGDEDEGANDVGDELRENERDTDKYDTEESNQLREIHSHQHESDEDGEEVDGRVDDSFDDATDADV